ncbi:unnamed protein product [Parnassius mnemosyne]|uniref:N-acetyltransferase domain-containing protein n=1 Tax=Parnassius mnemosyne TaxID=213953 RepID=A0AAV1KNT7_9NEOP
MDFSLLRVLPLHKHPEYLKQCCEMINEEWPRSETARMMSLQASCDFLPTSLILVNDRDMLLGHCKLTRIPSLPRSCFVETVVITKTMRGKKLGTFLMNKVEEYCKKMLRLEMVHLSTKGQEDFYSKLGYVICPPISIYGNYTPNFVSPNMITQNDSAVPKANIDTDDIALTQPPPPPPMPKCDNIKKDNSLRSNKTFMFKYLL